MKTTHDSKSYLPCLHGVRKASTRGEAVATATDEGDKFPPTTSTPPYNKLLSIETERHMARFACHPPIGREAAPSENHLPPEITKLPPRAPAPNKANQIFALHGRVLSGEVLGERGRFGGREPPLRKRGLFPSKVFPLLFFKIFAERLVKRAGL